LVTVPLGVQRFRGWAVTSVAVSGQVEVEVLRTTRVVNIGL
jgi:hypothetical protein